MTEVMGRPILAGLRMLLESPRLFTLPADRRLPAILDASRRYQADVSTRLSGQVVEALFELLRGLQAADARRRSGSHYTPRSLTRPIVETTLRPVLERLGPRPKPAQILSLKVADPAMGSGAFLVQACRHLADALVRAWKVHGPDPHKPADADEVLHARRLVAQHCLDGVDRNPLAVGLAKLSLWLATLARDLRFTFLDHALKEGDSLVGLTRQLIEGFHWKKPHSEVLFEDPLAERLRAAGRARLALLEDIDWSPYDQTRQKLANHDTALALPRLGGALAVEAFFAAAKDRDRERRLGLHDSHLLAFLGQPPDFDARRKLGEAQADLHRRVRPFHWQIEFPEVFERVNPGFDAVVGNPPFAGKNTITNAYAEGYLDWLKMLHQESHGNSDLVAHFFRRSFNLLRDGGAFGLIATNTIAQGDTRSTGLRWIGKHGGTIFDATRRRVWPGAAAVVASVVHVFKAALPGPFRLDGRMVDEITAFDDTDKEGIASPLSEYHRLWEKEHNRSRLFPYIGGSEVNDSPTHAPRRYVINFGDLSEEEARRWPDLMHLVEARVRPVREKDNRASYRRYWWQFAEKRSDLAVALRGLSRVLVISRIGDAFAFTFLPAHVVMNEKLVVFPFQNRAPFAVLQSRIHEVWTRFFSSTLKDDLQHTPSDCFETFPFPDGFEADPRLEAAGARYYTFRAELMVRRDEGLTKTYNRFHDPGERSDDIAELRRRHGALDRAVLDAYGWSDVPPACDFFPEHADEEEAKDEGGRSRRRRYRYRWPDEVRDAVLARLLEENRRRARGG